jgi:hypothetical protein
VVPNHALYQAKLRPEFSVMLITRGGLTHPETAGLFEAIKFISPSSALKVPFPIYGVGTGRELFGNDQSPRDTVPCCFRISCVVPSQSLINIFAGPDVTPPCLFTSQHVNVKHLG